jgi:hypothetical protein
MIRNALLQLLSFHAGSRRYFECEKLAEGETVVLITLVWLGKLCDIENVNQ